MTKNPSCQICHDTFFVCEDHLNIPWDDGDGCCGAPGEMCKCKIKIDEEARKELQKVKK